MKTIAYFFAFVFLATLLGCDQEQTQESQSKNTSTNLVELTTKQFNAIGIQVQTASLKERSGTINVNGVVDVPPGNKSYISLPYGGFIKKVNVLEGKRIQKGSLLFEVQNPEILALQQEYLEWIGKLDYLQGELNRQLKLESGNATSQKNVQAAKAELNVAKAKIKGLKARLKLANVDFSALMNGEITETQHIVAPFNGVVTKVTAAVGSYVSPQDKLMELIDLKHAHAELTVFEKDLPSMKIGQLVDVHFVNSSEVAAAEVYLIGGEIAQDRSVKVHCHFKKENALAIPGSFFHASIHVSARKTLTLPESAVFTVGRDRCVFYQYATRKYKLIKINVIGEEQGEVAFDLFDPALESSKFVTKGAFELLSLLNKTKE